MDVINVTRTSRRHVLSSLMGFHYQPIGFVLRLPACPGAGSCVLRRGRQVSLLSAACPADMAGLSGGAPVP